VAAQKNLSLVYSKGNGVAKDLIKAHMWANLAAASGNLASVINRSDFAANMSPAQIITAQKLASECQARNFQKCD
jgi:TPR repeat protein